MDLQEKQKKLSATQIGQIVLDKSVCRRLEALFKNAIYLDEGCQL